MADQPTDMRIEEDRYRKVCHHAETSDDGIALMLRNVFERLEQDPPDVFGAKLFLHGARLGYSDKLVKREANRMNYREDIARHFYHSAGYHRHGGPWTPGCKESDAPVIADCYRFADLILEDVL